MVPLYILTGLAIVAGFVNIPNSGALDWVPDWIALRFEHYFEPKGDYFPSVLRPSPIPSSTSGSPCLHLDRPRSASGWPRLWYFRGSVRTASRSATAARTGHRVLVNKYYFDWLYTDVIVRAIKGPIARAAYWFNQKVLDGVVDGAGTGVVARRAVVYDKIDQGVVDNIVNGSGAAAEGSGQGLPQVQTGRVQQYAALLFAAAAVLAGVLIVVI